MRLYKLYLNRYNIRIVMFPLRGIKEAFRLSTDFSRTLSLLRQEKGLAQRTVAKDLGISQALLSHYENGIREPGFAFLVKACDYYGVSADYLLGRTLSRDGTIITEDLYDYSDEKDNVLRGSVLATLNKKLLVNSVSLLFDLLSRLNDREAIRAASDYLSVGIYDLFRALYISNDKMQDFFSVEPIMFFSGISTADAIIARVQFTERMDACRRENIPFPDMSYDALLADYPTTCLSLMQVIHNIDERSVSQIEIGREFKTKKKGE